MTPRSYKCRFIEPGIISYEDSSQGVVFVGKPALDSMAASFRGCPVICVPENHNDAAPDVSFNADAPPELKPVGVVSGAPYWGDDGWQWVDFLVWDEATASKIDKEGYSVSCAYLPTATDAKGGTWHQIDYDEEITEGKYLHLAIVADPRYEGSRILANAKRGGNMKIKLFQKKPVEKKKENALEGEDLAPDAVVQLEDGTEVTLAALMEAYKAAKEEPAAEEPAMLNADDEVDVDGERVKVSEMINAYTAGCAKKNAEPPQDEPAAEEGLPKENAAKPVVNSAFREKVKAQKVEAFEAPVTRDERLAAGAARYSKTVKQEVK